MRLNIISRSNQIIRNADQPDGSRIQYRESQVTESDTSRVFEIDVS